MVLKNSSFEALTVQLQVFMPCTHILYSLTYMYGSAVLDYMYIDQRRL